MVDDNLQMLATFLRAVSIHMNFLDKGRNGHAILHMVSCLANFWLSPKGKASAMILPILIK